MQKLNLHQHHFKNFLLRQVKNMFKFRHNKTDKLDRVFLKYFAKLPGVM